jgi:hypothetical protein
VISSVDANINNNIMPLTAFLASSCQKNPRHAGLRPYDAIMNTHPTHGFDSPIGCDIDRQLPVMAVGTEILENVGKG